MARLTAISGPRPGWTVDLPDTAQLLVIGRDGADIDVSDPVVARRHAELSFRDGRWFVRNRRTGGALFLNDQPVVTATMLANGDVIRLGQTTLRFEWTPDRTPFRGGTFQEGNTGSPQEVSARQTDVQDVDGPVNISAESLNLDLGGTGTQPSPVDSMKPLQAGQRAVELGHGIKNVLQAIRGGREVIEAAIRKQRWDKIRQAWPILERNLDHVEKLVLDLLRFSRQYNPVFVRCDFNGIVRCVVETLQTEARRQHKTLELSTDDAMPSACMDPDQIYDLVLNLVLNGLQAVGPDGGRVRVQTRYDPDGPNACLDVADNGPGVADPDRIFQAFYTTRPQAGLGLGLAIVKKIVGQHGGRIDVHTGPEGGARFSVVLPLTADGS